MATPPDDFFRRQELELKRYTDRRISQFLKYLEAGRKEIYSEIAGMEDFSATRTFRLIEQIDEIIASTASDIKSIGPSHSPLAEMTKAHLESSIPEITGVRVTLAINKINTGVIKKFSENELAHVKGLVEGPIKQNLKSALFTKVGIKGLNPAQVARQLAGPKASFAGQNGRLETIMRTETSTVYNMQSLEGIQVANDEYDLTLNKRIVETIDNTRNHPISQVLNGQVRRPEDMFKAKVSQVEAVARRLKKGTGHSGVFWPIQDGYFVGMRLPAHYRERGIVTPTAQPESEI